MACTITHVAPETRSRIDAFLNRVPIEALEAKSEKERHEWT